MKILANCVCSTPAIGFPHDGSARLTFSLVLYVFVCDNRIGLEWICYVSAAGRVAGVLATGMLVFDISATSSGQPGKIAIPAGCSLVQQVDVGFGVRKAWWMKLC